MRSSRSTRPPTTDRPGALLRWPDEAVLLAAADRRGLIDRGRRLAERLRRRPDLALKDVASTLNAEAARSGAPARLGLVASIDGRPDRASSSRHASVLPTRPGPRSATPGAPTTGTGPPSAGLAFLFPGEGSQYPGMLADLCIHFPEVRAAFDRVDRMAIASGAAEPPCARLFGPGAEGDVGLWEVGTAVHVVLASQWAMYQLLRRLGLRPDAVCGHSSGELPALVAAGAIPDDGRLEAGLIELAAVFDGLERSGAIPEARLLAAAAGRERVEAAIGDRGRRGLRRRATTARIR